MKKTILAILAVLYMCPLVTALDVVQLPAPEKSGGVTLTQALSERRTRRDFINADLTPQQLSNLLWAIAGINTDDGRKVYPVAMNRQDMTVYVIDRSGVYCYDPAANALLPVREGDYRVKTGMQSFAGKAAVNLAYVQDLGFWNNSPEELARGRNWGFAHAGEMTQNAYLFAAGQGWAAVVRGMFDPAAMKDLLNLNEEQEVRLVHSIGPGK